MKSYLITLGISLLLATPSLIAQEQTDKDKRPAVGEAESVTTKATVESVDKAKREVTLKREDGTSFTVKCSEAVRNFDQIDPGDIVTATYSQAIVIGVRKTDEPPSATGRDTVTRAAPGEKPGGKQTSTIQISATIEKIDRDKRELSLKGPEGKTRTVKVPEEMKKFDQLKEGDQVVITATESLAISVTKGQ
jgi:cytoskeletal protein RodZ